MTLRQIVSAFTVAATLGGLALADNKGKKPAADNTMEAKMMAEMEKAAAPGEMHKWMKTNLAGSWTVAGKMFMGPKPMEFTGTEDAKTAMGDRYLVEEFKSTMMGKPFEGHSTMGWDNNKKQFVSTWIDNGSTGIMMSTGTMDEKTHTVTMTGTEYDMMMKKDVTAKMVLKIESDKKHTMEMFGPGPDGKEMKKMELVYTRK